MVCEYSHPAGSDSRFGCCLLLEGCFLLARLRTTALLPALAVVLGLVIGALLMLAAGKNPAEAYWAMLVGAFGGADRFGRTLEKATPLVMGGLAVALAFKAGLFNIGGQGQLLLGAAFGAYIGFRFSMPSVLHIPLTMLIGGLVASLLGMVVGALKAYQGDPRGDQHDHAQLRRRELHRLARQQGRTLERPRRWGDRPHAAGQPVGRDPKVGGLPLGFAVAVLAALAVWWLLERSTFGFEIKTAGANKFAATYAGIKVNRIVIATMGLSAFLAGVGGSIETQGVVGRFEPGFNTGLGFDGITIALLARTNPLAVVPAALLIGAMDAGSSRMQSISKVEPEIISVIQACILFFIAAPSVVRYLTRLRAVEAGEDSVSLSAGWGA
ncbi:MAG: ABC transporter permease [Acidimicrobiales bacterium]